MSVSATSQDPRWTRSRYGFVAFCFLSLLVSWSVLRLVLLLAFGRSSGGFAHGLLALGAGLYRDFVVALVLSIPLLVWVSIVRNGRSPSRFRRTLFWTAWAGFWLVEIFLLAVEFFFFEEFRSRFNTVAVDYLLYPHEVFINIWQSYHVGLVLIACAFLAALWALAAAKLFPVVWQRPYPLKARLAYSLSGIALAGILAASLGFKSAHIGSDRTLNEIANNGAISFLAAAWTRHLDYGAFYKMLPKPEAYERARRLLSEGHTQFLEPGASIRRQVSGDPNRPRLNVVLFLEESLGSEFWGCLGRKETLTPEMDKLANEEGLLFTHLYASGNRTVRGMEGVLASFPPLPGDSVVKRNLSDNVETIARVLKRDGYATLFLYGGRGLFDGMRSFSVRNGYDRFIEQKHFQNPTFTTIWGVSDEDLFARGIQECRELAKSGQPFFTTLLSVSNHKPYTYPQGRIPEDPNQRTREHAVKYSDYALGEFFRNARKETFWTNTVFVVVADHGARVYGEQTIPIHSYEIPLVIAGPAVVPKPQRVEQLGCSLDVAPTILGLIGRPYETLFFGRDLLRCPPGEGRALLNHNRDIGMLAHERLAVLGLLQTEEFYAGDPKRLQLVRSPDQTDRESAKDTAALYQVADDLYMNQRYALEQTNTAAKPGFSRN